MMRMGGHEVRGLALAATLLLQHLGVAAQESKRPKQRPVDERRWIDLRTEVRQPCLAFPVRTGAVVLLHKEELEALARDGLVEEAAPDDRHMARLNQMRAKSLLQSDFTAGVLRGCPVADGVKLDSQYLLLRQIELGQAAILAANAQDLSPRAVVRYTGSSGMHSTGAIFVFVPEATHGAVLAVVWWVS